MRPIFVLSPDESREVLMMGLKRSAQEFETPPPRRRDPKRTKLSPSADLRSDSSAASGGSVSAASALQSSPPDSEHIRQSSVSSLPSSETDDESESSLPTSSDESSESDSDGEIITVRALKKPNIRHCEVTQGAQGLRARLAALLPQLADASGDLATRPGEFNMEDVSEDEEYIEMNLGLGVLKEIKEGDGGSTSESTSDSDSEASEDEKVQESRGAVRKTAKDTEADVMSKLMGRPVARHEAGIEDLG